MFPIWPTTRVTFFAALVILPLTFVNKANANHWLLGDENAVHCYSADPAQLDAAVRQDMHIKGINMRWTIPIPDSAQLAAGKPIESAITVSLSPEFFQGNNITDLGSISVKSNAFQDLCYKKIAPGGNAACSSSVSPTPENCCIYHANIHACRQQEKDCQPWVPPMNSSANYVLVTHTNSVTGFLDRPITFENLVLPADTWTIISHVKILHFQCAIGVLRTIRNADSISAAQSNGSGHWPIWQISSLVSGITLAIVLISGITFFVYRKRKADRSETGSDQNLNNNNVHNNNDQSISSTNVHRQSTLRFSQGYVSPPISPSNPETQRFSIISNPYQQMIYVPCDQFTPPQPGYATYLSPQAPLNATARASLESNMVPMCYPDPNTGRYITYNQSYPYQQPPQSSSQYALRVVGDPNNSGPEMNLPVYTDDSRQHPMDYSFSASSTGKNDCS